MFWSKKKPSKFLLILCGGECNDFSEDVIIYKKHFDSVEIQKVNAINDIPSEMQNAKYDGLHVFLSENGVANFGEEILRTQILASKMNPSYVWFSSELSEGNIHSYFQSLSFLPSYLILTMNRRGQCFTKFLDDLFGYMRTGKRFEDAWVSVAPQTEGEWHEQLPVTIVNTGTDNRKFFGIPEV